MAFDVAPCHDYRMSRPVRIESTATTRTAERVVEHYVRGAVDIRWDDLEAFIVEVGEHPDEIVDEVVATAEDMSFELTAELHTALVAEAEAFTRAARRRVYAEQARRAGELAVAEVRRESANQMPAGTRVRFRRGAMPSCDGLTFVVVGEAKADNTSGGRLYVWLAGAADSTRGRSGYVDVLETL
jgi:hypothetical protein